MFQTLHQTFVWFAFEILQAGEKCKKMAYFLVVSNH
jgi:hypothetical protein